MKIHTKVEKRPENPEIRMKKKLKRYQKLLETYYFGGYLLYLLSYFAKEFGSGPEG